MAYRLIADIILITHFCYLVFVIFGGFLILRWRWIWKIHLPMVVWGFLVQYFVWICPLTNWENYYRELGGESGYENGFIDYFVTAVLYPDINATLHIILAILLVLINLAIYYYIFSKKNIYQEILF